MFSSPNIALSMDFKCFELIWFGSDGSYLVRLFQSSFARFISKLLLFESRLLSSPKSIKNSLKSLSPIFESSHLFLRIKSNSLLNFFSLRLRSFCLRRSSSLCYFSFASYRVFLVSFYSFSANSRSFFLFSKTLGGCFYFYPWPCLAR